MAKYRQFVSAGGIHEEDGGGRWTGVWLAVKDPFTWLFSGMHFALIIAQSFKDFFPSVRSTPYSEILHRANNSDYRSSQPSTSPKSKPTSSKLRHG